MGSIKFNWSKKKKIGLVNILGLKKISTWLIPSEESVGLSLVPGVVDLRKPL